MWSKSLICVSMMRIMVGSGEKRPSVNPQNNPEWKWCLCLSLLKTRAFKKEKSYRPHPTSRKNSGTDDYDDDDDICMIKSIIICTVV